MMKFTPTQWCVIVAAHMHNDAGMAEISSRRVKTRTISYLTSLGLLYSPNIDRRIELTPSGQIAFCERTAQ